MRIGIPKEVKIREGRIALIPSDVSLMIEAGHEVTVQKGAGETAGFEDKHYKMAGAKIGTVEKVWESEMVVKVKEPIECEYQYLREGLTLFSYLHLAANPTLVNKLVTTKTRAIALENIEMDGRLPGLDPMSKIAGRIAGQLAIQYSYSTNGGSGILLGGVDGTPPGKAVVVGGGVAGLSAAHELSRLGVNVVVFDIDRQKIATINSTGSNHNITAKYSSAPLIKTELAGADVLIGAVLIPGVSAPKIVTEAMIMGMKKGAVAVDIAIDQGGCFETSEYTSWDNPTFVKHGIIHICIPNMPGAVPRTSSIAVSQVILPQALRIARNNKDDEVIQKATSIENGVVLDARITQ